MSGEPWGGGKLAMEIQNLISIGIVVAALCYLGRYLVASLRDLFASQEGCAGGCGKCAFADNGEHKKPEVSASGLIALSDIKTLPKRPAK